MYSENNKRFNKYVSAGTPKPPNTKLTVFFTSLCLPRTSKQTGLSFFAFINQPSHRSFERCAENEGQSEKVCSLVCKSNFQPLKFFKYIDKEFHKRLIRTFLILGHTCFVTLFTRKYSARVIWLNMLQIILKHDN